MIHWATGILVTIGRCVLGSLSNHSNKLRPIIVPVITSPNMWCMACSGCGLVTPAVFRDTVGAMGDAVFL